MKTDFVEEELSGGGQRRFVVSQETEDGRFDPGAVEHSISTFAVEQQGAQLTVAWFIW